MNVVLVCLLCFRLTHWFSIGRDFASWGHLAVSGDVRFRVVGEVGERVVVHSLVGGGWGCRQRPTVHKSALQQRIIQARLSAVLRLRKCDLTLPSYLSISPLEK